MPDRININEDLKLETVLSYGEVICKDFDKSLDSITKLFIEGKINKVLVVTIKQVSVPSVYSLYYLSEKLPFGLKMAILALKTQESFENLMFFEITSLNKGKDVKIFNSIEEAKKWLFD